MLTVCKHAVFTSMVVLTDWNQNPNNLLQPKNYNNVLQWCVVPLNVLLTKLKGGSLLRLFSMMNEENTLNLFSCYLFGYLVQLTRGTPCPPQPLTSP